MGLFTRIGMTAGLAGALCLPATAATTVWKIDPQHTAAQFAVKHLMISTVRGEFRVQGGVVRSNTDRSAPSAPRWKSRWQQAR